MTSSITNDLMVSSCSTVVELTPRNQEGVSSNPANLLSFICGVFFIWSLEEVHLYLCVAKAIKMDAVAVLPGARQAQSTHTG